MTHFDEKSFDKALAEGGLMMVDFWAEWCGPCRSLGPIIEELAEDNVGKVKVCKVNVDEERPLAMKYRVMSIPMLVVMKNGKIVQQSTGAKPKNAILAML